MLGLIIEGITATGKTQILNELDKLILERKPNFSKIGLREFYTERVIEDHFRDGTMSKEILLRHIDNYLKIIERFSNMYIDSKWGDDIKNDKLIIYFERFIYSFLVKLEENFLDDSKISEILAEFSNRNIHMVILTLDSDVVFERIADTLNYRNSCWANFLKSLGDQRKIDEIFIKRQSKLMELAERFSKYIKTTYINSSTSEYDKIAEKIYQIIFTEKLVAMEAY